jgi:hypothetical protein
MSIHTWRYRDHQREGVRACRDGQPRSANPHPYSPNTDDPHWLWDEGWRQESATELLAVLRAIEPHLDAIVCYASTQGEHEPNRLAANARAAIVKADGPATDDLMLNGLTEAETAATASVAGLAEGQS